MIARSGAAAGLPQTLRWTGGTVGTAVLVPLFSTPGRPATGSAAHRLVQGVDAAFAPGTAVAAASVLVAAPVKRDRRA
ncbi:hypothetical protein LN042_00160 [Kitasatospora sp. RB6PN24]|uniref:hypothetical protein n=1 Tax=Kitasatospora humi TaxID=2893891 RepID=UPI001E4DE314|nr:hypothetical protein [Kitasatospora humi]MCC9305542.1 hypothetical protein [Kitasatospora humi]